MHLQIINWGKSFQMEMVEKLIKTLIVINIILMVFLFIDDQSIRIAIGVISGLVMEGLCIVAWILTNHVNHNSAEINIEGTKVKIKRYGSIRSYEDVDYLNILLEIPEDGNYEVYLLKRYSS